MSRIIRGTTFLRIDPKTRKPEVFAHEPRMNQPNDIAISTDGTLWASDPDWKGSGGQIWRIDRNRQGDSSGDVEWARPTESKSVRTDARFM